MGVQESLFMATKVWSSGRQEGVQWCRMRSRCAVCSWQGNSEVGAGTATILESKPGELVRLRMDWKEPMAGTATVDFTFKPQGEKTLVTWSMYGKNNFVGKVFSLFMDCDKMVGPQFEKGLVSLGETAAVR